MDEISHKDIYDRLVAVETKVDEIDNNTKGLVDAFTAAQGAFIVLEFLGKLAKPILALVAVAGGISIAWNTYWKK